MSVPNIFKVQIHLDTPESEVMIYTFNEATDLLSKGKIVAELERSTFANDRILHVYKYDKQFFMCDLHLGRWITTSTFDLYTNKDVNRKFVVVELKENVEILHGTLGDKVEIDKDAVLFSEEEMKTIEKFTKEQKRVNSKNLIPDKEYDEFEQHKQGAKDLMKDLQGEQSSDETFRRQVAEQLMLALHDGKITGEDYAKSMLYLANPCNNGDPTTDFVSKIELPSAPMEISTPPMFFETEHGNMICVRNIVVFDSDDSNKNVKKPAINTINGMYSLTASDVIRFREFAKLHGIFNK